MAFNSAFFAISTTPVLIAAGVGRTHVILQPAGGNVVIGGSGVTSTTGYVLAVGAPPTEFDLQDGDEVWAVRQSVDVDVSVITQN